MEIMFIQNSPQYGSLGTVSLLNDKTHGGHSDEAGRARRKTRSVLIVDDNPNFRMIVNFTLKNLGYGVLDTGSAEEAIEIATQNEDIQLLITDVEMPGMNGVELARKIREIRPGIKVLSTSGFPPKAVAGMGVATGSIHFLQKPFLPAQLDERIKTILAGE
jgi:CheY-like chemotaxis protein